MLTERLMNVCERLARANSVTNKLPPEDREIGRQLTNFHLDLYEIDAHKNAAQATLKTRLFIALIMSNLGLLIQIAAWLAFVSIGSKTIDSLIDRIFLKLYRRTYEQQHSYLLEDPETKGRIARLMAQKYKEMR